MTMNKCYTIIVLVLMILTGFSGVYANPITNNPNIIYVSSSGDDANNGLTELTSKGTIQNAINIAKNGDTIKVADGIYKENLQINKKIQLISRNANNTIIDGNKKGQCIIITPGIDVVISGFTIKNGKSGEVYKEDETAEGGAGIYNKGQLILKNSIVENNNAWRCQGGGIRNFGTLTISDTRITQNRAYCGGGIFNVGTLNINNSIVNGNAADVISYPVVSVVSEYCGGGIFNVGTLNINNSIVNGNAAEIDNMGGGGIYNRGVLNIQNSIIKNNHAPQSHGGGIANEHILTITNSSIEENTAETGGGISDDGQLTIKNSIIKQNTAKEGGGGLYKSSERIYNPNPNGNKSYSVSIHNSTIEQNTAGNYGGGIDNSNILEMSITDSTIQYNSAEFGGGVYNNKYLTMDNVNVYKNTATFGGGILNHDIMVIENSKIQSNRASTGGGICSYTNSLYCDRKTVISWNWWRNIEAADIKWL